MYLNKCYETHINFLTNIRIFGKGCSSKVNFLGIAIINLKLEMKNNFLLLCKDLLFVEIFTFIVFKNFNFHEFFSF